MAVKNSPKVSIVIPVYNGANFLGQAIDSALAQTYDNLEIVVVNDGSTDDGATERVAKAYGSRITYYPKKNGGVASALNYGIQKMTGTYCSWLSHDDLYEKTKVEDQVRMMQTLPAGNNVVVCNARTLFESGIKKEARIDKKTFEFFDIFLGTEADVGINGCALLIPRDVLIKSGGFDPGLPVTQDYDLWYRLYVEHHCRFFLLEKNLVAYRRHEGQDSVQKQQMCLDAGDALRHTILSNVSATRFMEYLTHDRANLAHTWSNYTLYKERGYQQTASMMLKYLLQYYHQYDLKRFYEVYAAQVKTDIDRGPMPKKLPVSGRWLKPTAQARQQIEAEYAVLLDAPTGFPVKPAAMAVRLGVPPANPAVRAVWRLGESVRRDGVYLTGEKFARKIQAKATRRTHK